jgi:hypothetical protein
VTKISSIMIAMAGSLALSACGGIGGAQKNLRSAVDARQGTLDDCYGTALERSKEASGAMQLNLHVAEKSGRVERVEVLDAGFADDELQSCVENALVGILISPKPAAGLKVEYRLVFNPTS